MCCGASIVLHAFEGKIPFDEKTRKQIAQLKSVYGLDLTSEDAHKLRGENDDDAE